MFVFRKPLFTVIMVPKRNSSDAGTASKPERSRDILSIIETVKILDMMEIKKSFLDIAWLCGKSESSIREVVKDKEKISLLYLLLRIKLKHQKPEREREREREREYTVNMQCSVQTLYYYII